MTSSCCGCCYCDDQRRNEEGGSRSARRRLGVYRQYSDVTLALQPMSYHDGPTGESNGHVSQLEMSNSGDQRSSRLYKRGGASVGCGTTDTTQVPLLVCAGLLAVFIGLASLLLVLFEPQLSFIDSLHLTVNLLMTLGFAGNLLPGMSAEASALEGKDGRQASQISLLIVACLILVGTTLLSSSFNVLMDSISHIRSAGSVSATSRTNNPTTYHHMPSPSRQLN